MPLLIATEGPLKGRKFLVKSATTIGRAEDADISIPDLMITRHHCRISSSLNGYFIEDLGSTNGTFVNGLLVKASTLLKDGDMLRVNDAVFRFRIGDDDAGVTMVTVVADEPPIVADAISAQTAGLTARSARQALTAESLTAAHQRLQTVVEVGKAVRAQGDLDALLKEIMEHFFRVFPQMDRGFIMLRVPGTTTMEVRLARQRDPSLSPVISVSHHIISEAVRRRIGILSADAMDDSRFAAARSVLHYGIRSMMCAPLFADKELLGVVHVDTTSADRRFTHDDLDLFTAVSNQMALAISYTRMHEQLRVQRSVEHELAMARQVQHSFLPAQPPVIPGFEFCATYQAEREIGGDFYDFIPTADGRLGIVLGDVMGKGMPAALMMVRMMRDIRFLAQSDPQPATVLNRLNANLTEQEVENSYVTLIYMLLDPRTRELSLSNAAHWPPLLRPGAGGAIQVIEAPVSGVAVGALSGTQYDQATLTLGPGDCLVLYTDGIVEAYNAREEQYGLDRLSRTLAVPGAGCASLMEALLADIRQFTGETPLEDDLTLVYVGAK